MLKKVAAAFEFLTIIPLPFKRVVGHQCNIEEIGRSSSVFPIVGLIMGGAYLLCLTALRAALSIEVCAVLVIALGVLITGGFHLDGVSDTFDALAAKRNTAERLLIMKSGSAGPIGVSAIVLTVLLKYALLKDLLGNGQLSGAFVLLTYPAAGRFAATAAMFTGRSARTEGLGWIFIEHTGMKEFIMAALLMFAIFTLSDIYTGGSALCAAIHAIIVIVIITAAARMTGAFFQRRFGGLTGDTMGAFIEGSELIFLIYMAIGGHTCPRGFI
ncbi:MAG: adenosylcobinamide-GDP ribazoletransferase [Candidatus Magnetominusculus sp. LBB02]|nr:adenosylcobinamide-GDP ribazoletransferase [Candidatus Magnetominusculus sp. LBB02]